MNEFAAALCFLLFIAYFPRTIVLQYGVHDWTFVAQNVLGCTVCLYSSYALWTEGLMFLCIVAPLMAGLYLLRSRETYREAKTGPIPFDDQAHHHVYGGRQ